MTRFFPTALSLLCLTACTTDPAATSPWEDEAFNDKAEQAVERYVHIVMDSYSETIAAAEALRTAIDAFVATPSDATLEAAKSAWLTARDTYGQTEVYRFYDGPIDAAPDNLEGLINSWPMDESYVDYVDGAPDAGLVNDLTNYPKLDRDTLVERNGAGGEDDISTGWHAIEFLLWGQDLRADGPGARPYTDYVVGAEGTAANQDRRGQYLSIVTDLLIDDLTTVHDAWNEGAEYHETFEHGDAQATVTKILLGMGSLSGAELSGERMGVAYGTHDQEDEHSCFSDNTVNDFKANALGIENVYLGRWGGETGASLSDLVASRDPELDRTMKDQLAATNAAIAAIPAPFDQAIADGSPGLPKVADAIAALKAETTTLAAIAEILEIELNLEE